MRIMEVEIRDSENIVIYHADRYNSDNMETIVKGFFDKEEDCTMKVVIEQNYAADHAVRNPSIDVRIDGCNKSGNTISKYVDMTLTNNEILGDKVRSTFSNIVFRPKNASKLSLDVRINEKHGADGWRENEWIEEDDHFHDTIDCTTADLAVSQDIELYNSKNNKQEYLTFAEYLDFKFNVKHIGNNQRARAIVGGSSINPNPRLNVRIYNADKLSRNHITNELKYSNVFRNDPKAATALVREKDISTASRIYPGLGSNGYASHVQAWLRDYIIESRRTATGNVAAYGHILVSANIDPLHDHNDTNIRDHKTDYVQKEFKGEKDLQITDIAATARNSVSEDTGVSVQVAIKNAASSYNDQTVIDKTYVDILIDMQPVKTIIVEVPVGETIIVEAVIPKVKLDKCMPVEARVNTGKHQTHYEYVLRTTNRVLNEDPFANNYKVTSICPNIPDDTICPECVLTEGSQVNVQDIFQ